MIVLSLGLLCRPARLSAAPAPAATQPADAVDPIRLWSGDAPGSAPHAAMPVALEEHRGRGHVENVSVPEVEVFLPPAGRRTGAGVVVCPGGGYRLLAIGKEGEAVARRFNAAGVAAFVLKYRTAPPADDVVAAALLDGKRAIRLVRGRAAEWGVDPARLGIMGFSAGGHVALNVALHPDAGDATAADPIDRLDARPAFVVLVYPWIYDFDYDWKPLVTAQAPPTFIVHARNDLFARPQWSVDLDDALRRAGVPEELRLYATGGHGFGLGRAGTPAAAWPDACLAWMRDRHLLAN